MIKSKKNLKNKMSSIRLLLVLILFVLIMAGHLFSGENRLNESFQCPDGCVQKKMSWGKNGYSYACLKGDTKHGRWIAIEGGKILIEGKYYNGLKEGKWYWYHNDGSIYRLVVYEKGVEIKNEVFKGNKQE